MPLLNICGTTSERKTFSIASIFLSGEDESRYRWALATLLALLAKENIRLPRVILTDRDLALMNAIVSFKELEGVVHILCRWHVNKNVLAKCKQHFPKAVRDAQGRVVREPTFQAFLDEWQALSTLI
ncbi:MULE transposase [Hirsutella rhossiliensis]|uniref:MULE transposase domain-containing protein n=1 Tax=Hirsutella rhossiliensis TaxID=111463 RepID=A0A9P8MSS2_9HYPO|nr:MULE transposase domain-containing protein [Hirsutella rhossiliensis]KAH0959774.1 MULE transposase domain-containing protein [Hirsutella rhossiliensis]